MTSANEPPPEDLFVKVPVALIAMVEAGELKPAEAWMFVLLLKHVNTKRAGQGDTNVWPSQKTLAPGMGIAPTSSDKLAKYVDKLVKKKLITKTPRRRNGMKISNLYKLNIPSSARTHQTVGTEPPAETVVSAAQDVPTERGVRTYRTGGYVPTERGGELKELELEEEPPPPTCPPPAAGPSTSAPGRKEEAAAAPEDQTQKHGTKDE